jgi:GNAT superfamily N-acetyltransferase
MALTTLLLAFGGDPAVRWLYPDPQHHLAHFCAFARAFGGASFRHGSAFADPQHKAVALWLPPEVEPDEAALGAVIDSSVRPEIHGDLFSLLEQMAAAHPEAPHWYLALLGVDPLHQGRGRGSRIIRHGLRTCDRDGLPAYLETGNPRNVQFYERHGFRITHIMQSGSSPRIYGMLRAPRHRGDWEES